MGVVTNSKDFDLQLERLGQYVNFTEAFKQGKVPLNTPRVTTGKFSGKPVPSGSFTPGGRFVRAATTKNAPTFRLMKRPELSARGIC